MDKVIWQRTFGNINGGQSRKRSSELSKTMVFPVASVTKVLTVKLHSFRRLYYWHDSWIDIERKCAKCHRKAFMRVIDN